jgi:outer membrane protein TolC
MLLGCLMLPNGWAQPALTVDQAVERALLQNPRLASTQFDVAAAQAQVGVASATLYPNINLVGSSSSQSNRGGGGNNSNTLGAVLSNLSGNNNGGGGGQGLTQISLNVNQILLDFGKRAEAIRATQKQAEAAQYQADSLRQDVILEVRTRYYQTHTDQETVRIQQGVVQNQERHVLESQGFYKAGMQARIEVTKAESDLAQARLDLVLAQNSLEQDWVALNQSMGVSQTTTYALSVYPLPEKALDPPLDRVVELSYQYRPEARQLAALIEAATARMELAYRNRYPTLGFNAQTGYRALSGSPLDDYWSVGLNLNFNLFNGYLDRFQAEGFKAQAESLAQLLESTRQQVYRDTATALITLRNARAAIEASEVSVRSSQENFTLARKRYESGLGSNLEYQDAQLLLARAQIAQNLTLNRYRTAVAALLRATGIEQMQQLQKLMEAHS